MVAFKNLFIFVVGISALNIPSPVKRQAAAIQSGLTKINNDIGALNTAINNYNGGVSNAVPVQNAANTLNNDLKSVTTTVNNSPVATSAESKSIIAYVNNTLKPSTTKVISALIAKKSKFAADGLQGVVCDTLKTTSTNVNNLANALVNKASADQKSAATAAKNAIVAEVNRGVAAFC